MMWSFNKREKQLGPLYPETYPETLKPKYTIHHYFIDILEDDFRVTGRQDVLRLIQHHRLEIE